MYKTLSTRVLLPGNTARNFMHRGTRADLGVIEQIFNNRDYDLHSLGRGKEFTQLFQSMMAAGQKPLIVDCGANIGASACWFSAAFPGVHVVCFEPDAANFELLQTNVKEFDTDLRRAAISATDGAAIIVNPDAGEWAYRTQRSTDGDISAIAINRIVAEKKAAGFTPFIVKIDIEGGEEELFSQDTGWIADFPILIIELHDWLFPKKGTSLNFLKAIAGHDRDFIYLGENIFSLKNA